MARCFAGDIDFFWADGDGDFRADLTCDGMVDDVQRMVFVSTLGRSLTVILSDMARQGATQLGKPYEIMYRNTNVGSVVFRPIT